MPPAALIHASTRITAPQNNKLLGEQSLEKGYMKDALKYFTRPTKTIPWISR